jgi:hypothetical protein
MIYRPEKRKKFMSQSRIFTIRAKWRNFYMEPWEKLLKKAVRYINETPFAA